MHSVVLLTLCASPSWAWISSYTNYRSLAECRSLLSSSTRTGRRYAQQRYDADVNNADNTNSNANDEDKFQTAEYGVSYIGGDPCGSKYNDDPFDAANNRSTTSPGFPTDMKKRIEAMAEQIKAQQEQQKEES